MTAPGDDLSVGMGTLIPSDDAVFPSIAQTTRVCAYDRPDVRFEGEVTTPRPQPHTVDLDVEDLHALLTAIGEPEPYVLVSHSYGGLVSALHARTHPESVAGVVMVDTASEVMEEIITPGALDWWDDVNSTTDEVVREGVMVEDAFARINAAPPMPANGIPFSRRYLMEVKKPGSPKSPAWLLAMQTPVIPIQRSSSMTLGGLEKYGTVPPSPPGKKAGQSSPFRMTPSGQANAASLLRNTSASSRSFGSLCTDTENGM